MARSRYAVRAGDLGAVVWRKSRRSNSTGTCVEFAELDSGQVAVRNSKHPTGPALLFDRDDIAAFVAGLKAGSHDHLLTAPG